MGDNSNNGLTEDFSVMVTQSPLSRTCDSAEFKTMHNRMPKDGNEQLLLYWWTAPNDSDDTHMCE